jgi:predicted peroxiredoxin
MDKKKYIFILNHATQNPMEVIGLMKVAINMKAFDDTVDVDFFLMGEGVQLAKPGVAATISMEMEGQTVVAEELLKTLTDDFGVKLYICHAFMPAFGMTKDNLVSNTEVRSSSYLGELFLDGRVPFSLNL